MRACGIVTITFIHISHLPVYTMNVLFTHLHFLTNNSKSNLYVMFIRDKRVQ